MQLCRITPWLAGLTLAVVGVSRAAAHDEPISANVARSFVGEEKVVEGTVTAAEREANVVHLDFGNAPQALTVSLIIGLLSDFPRDPEHYYVGHAVRVVGTIRSFKGRPEIVIHDPADIKLTDVVEVQGGHPAAASDDTAALREQVKTLNEHVHMLEDQLRKLQRPATPEPK